MKVFYLIKLTTFCRQAANVRLSSLPPFLWNEVQKLSWGAGMLHPENPLEPSNRSNDRDIYYLGVQEYYILKTVWSSPTAVNLWTDPTLWGRHTTS